MRKCSKCGETKPPEQFNKRSDGEGGLRRICKACFALRRRLPEVIQRHRVASSKHSKTAKGKASRRQIRKRLELRCPEKALAWARVKNEIRRGRMPRASALACAKCGQPAHEYHHHRGYLPPHDLDVIALCRECHYKEKKAV